MKRRGTGVGCMFYGVGNTGLPNPAAAFVEVLPDTSVNVTVGAADIGQGSSTMAATIVVFSNRMADSENGRFVVTITQKKVPVTVNTVMWASEMLDKDRLDTFFEKV